MKFEKLTAEKDLPPRDICAMVTGPRPKSLGGYPNNNIEYERRYGKLRDGLAGVLQALGHEQEIAYVWSGMAQGVDQIAAEATLALKEAGEPIHAAAAIPFVGQENRWPAGLGRPFSRDRYAWLVSLIEKQGPVCLCSEGDYSRALLFKRNEWMAIHSSWCVGVWPYAPGSWQDPTRTSGTAHALKVARALGLHIQELDVAVNRNGIVQPTQLLTYPGKGIPKSTLETVV